MSTLVIAEHDNLNLKPATLNTVAAAKELNGEIHLLIAGNSCQSVADEASGVVRQALEILTPSMPGRMEDGNPMLTHWTKKIIVEDGHTGAQLVNI